MPPDISKETQHRSCTGYKRTLFCAIFMLMLLTYITFWSSNALSDYAYHFSAAIRVESSQDQDIQNGSFIFIETAGHKSINARQACSVESAALRHPSLTVQFLVTAPPSDTCTYFNILRQISNIKIKYLNVEQALAGTPLESWYNTPQRKASPFAVSHLSDALRFLMLWRHGGIYADTDVIVQSPMSGLRNTLGKEHATGAGSAVLIFDLGEPFLTDAIQTFAKTYDPYVWAMNGPDLLGRMLQKRCPGVWNVTDASLTCGSIRVLSSSAFFLVPWQKWNMMFDATKTSEVLQVTNNSYAIHFWNKMSKDKKVVVGSNVTYDVLARMNCPKVYEAVRTTGYF